MSTLRAIKYRVRLRPHSFTLVSIYLGTNEFIVLQAPHYTKLMTYLRRQYWQGP